MQTLLLDLDNWDLCLDAAGDLAVAANPYSIAQDVASAVRLFVGELYYDAAKGIPYFDKLLRPNVPLGLIKYYVEQAAKTVPEVVSATCLISGESNRTLTGQVQVTDVNGDTTVVNIA